MEVKINREIRNYTESMFFGLSLRQLIFSALAVAVAVGLYFLMKPYVGTETVSTVFPLSHKSSVTSPPSLNTGKFRPIRFSGYSDSSFL